MTQPYQLVVDTNVLITAFRSQRGAAYKFFTLLNDPRWQLNLSIALVFEYEEILKREQESLGLTQQEIDTLLDGLCAIANHQDIFYQWRPLSRDPDDDFLIDLAIKSQAHFIITYNQRDLQQAAQFGIQLLTPKAFLQLVGELPS
ncbi:putative toxin-antitoxin system toxin component, PIN family [Leptolyngbya sp. AN03gr2]|uniref:putative toxin-antitoxin system toxin component, PIN family n=1 Tax=unclassified Leptolyngbya TaxID=2650499 RepID=UPI003D31D9D9